MNGQGWIEIGSDRLRAAINPFGAELSSLQDGDGRELMTDADPAFWTGRAPLLFPIVGALSDDRYRLADGREFSLPSHGFARRQPFALVEQAPDRAAFRLIDNEETLAVYPFAFTLDAAFVLTGATLAITVTATNRGDDAMPASFGFHPAFAWPLPYGAPREGHRMVFAQVESEPVRRVSGKLIDAAPHPSPVQGRELPLADHLFTADAIIWDAVRSESLLYGAADGPQLEIGWRGMPSLGIWSKPGAAFVCVEPWQGHADPVGFDGTIWDKPGMMRLEPGEARDFAMQVTLR